MTKRIRISEIFGPTIQGEGPLIGRCTVFVRTAGCDYRCTWCDTLYAVLPEHSREWPLMTCDEILARIDELSKGESVLVSLSGGNPALQPLQALISLGRRRNHTFALETQGSVAQPWFSELDYLILSPKPPSSGMATDWSALNECLLAANERPYRALKIVIFDDADYRYARTTADRYPNLPLFLQVGNPDTRPLDGQTTPPQQAIADLMARFRWLVSKVVADQWFSVTVLPQLHVLAWGNKRAV